MLAQDSIRGNATVTSTHVKTRDLAAHTRRADILVAAAGVPQLIGGDMIKPGATVIDVGVHRTADGLVGDVSLRRGGRGRRGDHPGARRGRADDGGDAAREHRVGRGAAGVRAVSGGRASAGATSVGGRLGAVLRSGAFAVTGEIVPPRDADGDAVTAHARALVGSVDAANVTDNPTATAHMSAVAGCAFVARAGIEPTLQLTCRDRNRLAITADLLGAWALGARTVLCLSGDPMHVGDEPDAVTVGDMTVLERDRRRASDA